MPLFSLIVPTLGRTDELCKLFRSLNNQPSVSIELLVVDQNDDDRIAPLLSLVSPQIELVHLRVARKSLPNARNEGLAYARGRYVAFPDDDCWYPPSLLARIASWFAAHPDYQILTVGADDERGVASGNRWFQDACDITPYNSLRTTFANTLFLQRSALPDHIRFAEDMASSEETDYILQLLKAGLRGRFDRSMRVGHPCRDMLSGTVSHERARKYGYGMGQLVRRHSLPLLWSLLLAYDLLRAAIVAVRGDGASAIFCLAHLRGLFVGFFEREPRLSSDLQPQSPAA